MRLRWLIFLLLTSSVFAGDWPMWRHDANRSASTDEELAPTLHLQWTRKLPPHRPTWPDAPRVTFDASYHPVVAGALMFVALPYCDKVVALDTTTGEEKWSFYAEGPVRYAPVAFGDAVLLGSDDGYLYCVDAASGKLRWKFRGGPSEQRLLGHDRLIARWPVSSGPAIADGKVYFSAGIWPFMSVFYHALDVETGKVVWTNDGTSFLFRAMPKGHSNATALSGPTPQGYAVVAGDKLLIPCGRSLPACFDAKTGEFLYYEPTEADKVHVKPNAVATAAGDVFFDGRGVFDATTGKLLRLLNGDVEMCTPAGVFAAGAAWDHRKSVEETYKDWRGNELKRVVVPKLYDLPQGKARLKAGRTLYMDVPGSIFSVKLPAAPDAVPEKAWSVEMKETVEGMLAAGGRLFVVTVEGSIHCFGPTEVEPKTLAAKTEPLPAVEDAETKRVADILKQTDLEPGYAIVLGVRSARVVEELVKQSPFHVIGVDVDAAKVDAMRRRFDAVGLYGQRVSLHVADPTTFDLPPFLARLIVCEDPELIAADSVTRIFRSLRPYGGTACFILSGERREVFEKAVASARHEGATVKLVGDLSVLRRPGALDGAGEWTHDNSGPGRRVYSNDRALKAPLGVLWFGGESGGDIAIQGGYPSGPSPLVFGGRMILQCKGCLLAVDAYTGRTLWKTELTPLADRSVSTRAASLYCYSWAAAKDAIYIGYAGVCRVFDPATGKEIASWKVPAEAANSRWGNMLVVDDVLVAALCEPVDLPTLPLDETKLAARQIVRLAEWMSALLSIRAMQTTLLSPTTEFANENLGKLLGPDPIETKFPRMKTHRVAVAMENAERLIALDRKTGKVLWTHLFASGCQHNSALVAGGGKVFAADAWPKGLADLLKLRGKLPDDYRPTLVALDLKTGSTAWRATDEVMDSGGLSYSPDLDMLLQAGGPAVRGRVARSAADGNVLWKRRIIAESYGTWHPSIIAKDTLVNFLGQVYDLKTGDLRTIPHPLTGQPVPWTMFTRSHGCNHAVATQNLMMLRVGNAAYVDLLNFAGTHSLGGFRSGCQNSLIVGDGVLCAPRYSRCGCAYPVFTSLGLIHDPEVETWSFYGLPGLAKGPVQRVGLNLGAPGDRMADDGTLWIDYPSVGGPSPEVPVKMTPENVRWFRHHAASLDGDGLKWVAASGAKGLRELTVTLDEEGKAERTFAVHLYFVEPDDVKPGQRLFSISLQGEEVLKDVDIVWRAGGPMRPWSVSFKDIRVTKDLAITLTPSPGCAISEPILCGVEAVETEAVP